MNVLVIREILLVEALTTVLTLAEVCYKSRNINTVTENSPYYYHRIPDEKKGMILF